MGAFDQRLAILDDLHFLEVLLHDAAEAVSVFDETNCKPFPESIKNAPHFASHALKRT